MKTNEEIFTGHLAELFHRRPDVFTGIGDDAAALDLGLPDGKLLLAAADQVIEGVHFTRETEAKNIAEKLLRRNISDLAAMGGVSTHALVTVAANPMDEARLAAFHRALSDAADEYNISVIGGDLARLPAPGWVASLSLLGWVEKEKLCLRSNARAGDHLYLTGSFGRSFPSGRHLYFHPRAAEARFLAGTYTHAMMDVSDGLAKDLARFAAASGLAVRLTCPDAIPRRDGATLSEALNDGEDYELIFAVPPEKSSALRREWFFKSLPLTLAGVFENGDPGALFIENQPFEQKGYDHFYEN